MPKDNFIAVPQDVKYANILLINADFSKNELGLNTPHENHLGLHRLASYLHTKDITAQIINTTGQSEGTDGSEKLAEWLNQREDTFETLGFYVTSWNVAYIVRILKNLKQIIKNKPIFLGGPLPSAAPDALLEYLMPLQLQNIGLVKGFGEFILEKMIRSRNNFSSVDGIWSYQNGERTHGKLHRLNAEEMATLPLLNHRYNTFHQLYYKPCVEKGDLGEYSLDFLFGSFGLDTNHGCPFSCSYCSVPLLSRSVDLYTPKRVADEMEHTAKETGIFMYTFTYSNVMFYRPEWLRKFCEEILRRKMEHYVLWNGYHHPNILDQLDISDFFLMKEAGCNEIVIGVQSIEENICDFFHRPKDTFEKVKRLVSKLQKTGQRLVIDYITNVPGENIDAIEMFYKYCMDNDIECRNFDLKIYPGTELSWKKLDLTNHDLIPITGDIPPDLGAYLFMSKRPNTRLAKLQLAIHENNQKITRKKPLQLGKYEILKKEYAERLLNFKIPQNMALPEKIKKAFTLILKEILHPKERDITLDACNMNTLLKKMADTNAPPVIQKMKERMIREMGEEKFQKLLQKLNV